MKLRISYLSLTQMAYQASWYRPILLVWLVSLFRPVFGQIYFGLVRFTKQISSIHETQNFLSISYPNGIPRKLVPTDFVCVVNQFVQARFYLDFLWLGQIYKTNFVNSRNLEFPIYLLPKWLTRLGGTDQFCKFGQLVCLGPFLV